VTNYPEIVKPPEGKRTAPKAVLLDFDGTVSALRQGWESVMEQMMADMIAGPGTRDQELKHKVRAFINDSAGIQTIYQMQWLVEQLEKSKRKPEIHDVWWYKNEYNRRLLEVVDGRTERLLKGESQAEDFRIKGSLEFLQAIFEGGIDIYIASGTDDADVRREVELLGIGRFVKHVAGAPHRQAACSKEAVIKDLIKDRGIKGKELVVIGDGKVEIELGTRAGAICIGAATDEIKRYGINEFKRTKLIIAGANAIVGDFIKYTELMNWMGIDELPSTNQY